MSITIIIMASEYFIDHHCEYFFFCERCVNENGKKQLQQYSATIPGRRPRRESAPENRNDGSRATNDSGPGRADRRAAIHSLLPIRLESEQQPCSTSNNLTQDDRGGLDGENLRAKIATMAAGRRTRAAPDGQTRRDSFFIANSTGKRTTTLSINEQQHLARVTLFDDD